MTARARAYNTHLRSCGGNRDVRAGLFRVLPPQCTNEILLGKPSRHIPAPRNTARDAGRTAKGPHAEGSKLLNCFPFIFPPPPPYILYTHIYIIRTGVNKTRELVNLTARRPFPAPPRRPFSRAPDVRLMRFAICLRALPLQHARFPVSLRPPYKLYKCLKIS